MAGKKGRSGPPGHRHSRGNGGGMPGVSGPPNNRNAATTGAATIDRLKDVPQWIADRFPALAERIDGRAADHLRELAAGDINRELTAYQKDVLELYTTAWWLLETSLEDVRARGPFNEKGDPRPTFERLLPRAIRQVAELLPLLKSEEDKARGNEWAIVDDILRRERESAHGQQAAQDAGSSRDTGMLDE